MSEGTPDLNSNEIAFSIAMSTSVLLTFLRAIRQMAEEKKVEIPPTHDDLIATLEQLLEEMIRQSGEERAMTGYEKTRSILELTMQLSRPGAMQ